MLNEIPSVTGPLQDPIEVPASVISSAEQVKEQGNTAFKAMNYVDAIDLYSKAIGACTVVAVQLLYLRFKQRLDILPTEPAYFTNRAAAYMALKKYKPALADCQQAASMQSSSPSAKTLMRLARCQLALGSSAAALSTLRTVLDVEPGNASAVQLRTKISELESHLLRFQNARAKKEWSMAHFALTKCLQSIEGEGADIPIEWRIWRIELELARCNLDSAIACAK
jgi:DnaJ homolog subfamily C member 7